MILKKFSGLPLRPAQRAAELLPQDQRWCSLCHQSVLKNAWGAHIQSKNHRLAQKKLNKMKQISLSLWEKHRGAPLEMESARERDFEKEFSRYQQNQRIREEEALKQLW